MRISDWSSDVCSSDLRGKCRLEAALVEAHLANLTQCFGARQHFGRGAAIAKHVEDIFCLIANGIEQVEFAERFKLVAQIAQHDADQEVGRASCRERGCKYVKFSVGGVGLTKNTTNN